jgi:hypothetical protein
MSEEQIATGFPRYTLPTYQGQNVWRSMKVSTEKSLFSFHKRLKTNEVLLQEQDYFWLKVHVPENTSANLVFADYRNVSSSYPAYNYEVVLSFMEYNPDTDEPFGPFFHTHWPRYRLPFTDPSSLGGPYFSEGNYYIRVKNVSCPDWARPLFSLSLLHEGVGQIVLEPPHFHEWLHASLWESS